MLNARQSDCYFFTDRINFIMIWASKKPDHFLNMENQIRLVHLLQNRQIKKIFFYYSRSKLNSEGLDQLESFANTHKSDPVQIEFRDIDTYFISKIMSHRDNALLGFALQELDHNGGNLAAMSDLIRVMETVLSEGMYMDFDLKMRFDHFTEDPLQMPQPIMVDIEPESKEINNDAITLARGQDRQVHPESLNDLHMWQDAILEAYRNPIEALNSQQLAAKAIYRLRLSALSRIEKLSIFQIRAGIQHPLNLYLFLKLHMIYPTLESDLYRSLPQDQALDVLEQLTNPDQLDWSEDVTDRQISILLECYQNHIRFAQQCLKEKRQYKENELTHYDSFDPSMTETIELLRLEIDNLLLRSELYQKHLEKLARVDLTVQSINTEFERMYSQEPFYSELLSLYKDSVLVFSGPIRLALFLQKVKEQKNMSYAELYHQFSFKSIGLDLKLKESEHFRGLTFSQQDGSWHAGGQTSQAEREARLNSSARIIQQSRHKSKKTY